MHRPPPLAHYSRGTVAHFYFGANTEGDDQEIAACVLAGDVERIAMMLSIAVERTIRCDIEANQAALLEKVAQNLLEIARETQDRAAAGPPRSPDSVQTRDSLAD